MTKIAVAQLSSVKGDISVNIASHLAAIKKAAHYGVNYLVFPELSLTGYEPELAATLAFSTDDQRLAPLIAAANKYQITIAVGAPLLTQSLPQIGLIIISPSGAVITYAKMHLHPGEEPFFEPGQFYNLYHLGKLTIANAICADTNEPTHANDCAEAGANVYIAGVLITAAGYQADTRVLSNYAKESNMLIAMANHNQPTGGWLPVGKSAMWCGDKLLACANETENALVIAKQQSDGWSAQLVQI